MKKNSYRLIQPILRNNQFRGIFFKYLIGAVSTALTAFIIYGVFSYNLYALSLQDSSASFHETNLYKTSGLVDYIFDSVDQAHQIITHNKVIRTILDTPASNLPDKTKPDISKPIKTSDITKAVNDLFRETLLSPAMESIYLYSEVNSHFFTWTDFREKDDFEDSSVLNTYLQGSHFFAWEKRGHTGFPNVITLAKEIYIDNRRVGVAFYNLRYSAFSSYVKRDVETSPETVLVTDTDGNIFFSTETSVVNTNIREHPYYGEFFSVAKEEGTFSELQGANAVFAVTAKNGGHIVISTMTNTSYLNFQRVFFQFALWGSLSGILIAFFIAYSISYRIYRNTLQMMSFLAAPEGGLDGGGDPAARQEMDYITGNMGGLVSRNQRVENELAEKLVELKKAQSIALQNQINPHFILNTLQMVNLDILGYTGEDTVATKVISLLSDILQSNLNTTDHIVPLAYEIRQAMKYIEIENIRNQGKFTVTWEQEEDLAEYKTVKFIIQPILENSLKHGLTNNSSREKKVQIRICRDGKALVIVVRDNGNGIPPDTLEDLRRRLSQSHIQENSHIGLCNVDKRIKLVFGEGYGVSIDSVVGEGTEVVIRQRLVSKDWQD